MNLGCAREQTVVTGMGAVCGGCDAAPFLRMRKLRKFMGRQDELAVAAAGRALESASLRAPLGERCGLYLAVGYIPSEGDDINQLLDASLEGQQFSMARFAANAFGAINPLLTFRVLPNMPAFHVSLNFDVQGPYAVSYPGAGQFYVVLEEALAALESNAIDVALVGAVADQQNMLVEHHFSRIATPIEPARLVNAGAFLVIERTRDANARGAVCRAKLSDYSLTYEPVDPFGGAAPSECLARDGVCVRNGQSFGPASLGFALAGTSRSRLTHRLRTRDGFIAASAWEVA
jgi:3-oxoacyl-(acyl-carrier-protein) synthase